MFGLLIEDAAEMIFQVTNDFIFYQALQHDQHDAQSGPDANLPLADSDPAVYAWPFKMNVVFFPAIVDAEFFRQVPGKLVRRLLSVFLVHRVVGTHIYDGHCQHQLLRDRACVDRWRALGQFLEPFVK